MSGAGLIGITVSAGILIVIAVLTPGWFGLDIKTQGNEVSISMNIFYCRVCGHSAEIDGCTTISVTNAVAQNQFKTGATERYTELTIEAVGTLIGIVVGGILAVIFGASIRKRDNMGGSSALAATSLVFSIIGGICGGILAIEFIIAHANFDEAEAALGDYLENDGIEKSIPYSLIIMCFGLTLEFIAVIVLGASMRSNYRGAPSGIVLTPSINGPGTVVVEHSTVSSTPYARFA